METESTAPNTPGGTSSWITDIFGCVDCLEQKLNNIIESMHTEAGRAMARPKAERILIWRGWWDEEVTDLGGSDGFKGCAKDALDGSCVRGRSGAK
jgi:hypothetical protein